MSSRNFVLLSTVLLIVAIGVLVYEHLYFVPMQQTADQLKQETLDPMLNMDTIAVPAPPDNTEGQFQDSSGGTSDNVDKGPDSVTFQGNFSENYSTFAITEGPPSLVGKKVKLVQRPPCGGIPVGGTFFSVTATYDPPSDSYICKHFETLRYD